MPTSRKSHAQTRAVVTGASGFIGHRRWENCRRAKRGVEQGYALAANMGWIGFIEANKAGIMYDAPPTAASVAVA